MLKIYWMLKHIYFSLVSVDTAEIFPKFSHTHILTPSSHPPYPSGQKLRSENQPLRQCAWNTWPQLRPWTRSDAPSSERQIVHVVGSRMPFCRAQTLYVQMVPSQRSMVVRLAMTSSASIFFKLHWLRPQPCPERNLHIV